MIPLNEFQQQFARVGQQTENIFSTLSQVNGLEVDGAVQLRRLQEREYHVSGLLHEIQVRCEQINRELEFLSQQVEQIARRGFAYSP